MLLGALSGNSFLNLKYSALYARIVITLWGSVGGTIFSIALLFAALTTAIGLTAATSEYFEEVYTNNRFLSYKKVAIATLLVSTFISSLSLTNILALISPLLQAIYPSAIILTIFYALVPNLNEKKLCMRALKFALIISFIYGFIDSSTAYERILHIKIPILKDMLCYIPLSKYKLGWIPIAVLTIIISFIWQTLHIGKTNRIKK